MEKALQAFDAKVEFYGDDESSYFGSIADDCTGAEVGLRGVNFVKAHISELQNTSTDIYSIECACGIELNSTHITEDGESYCDHECGGSFSSLEACRESHKTAFLHVINKWNSLGV